MIVFGLQSAAQTLIPNQGFESWQPYDTFNLGHDLPSKWTVLYSDSLFMLNKAGIVRKSTNATRGTYCVQMVVDSSNNLYHTETLQNTFPFKGKPTSLRFFSAFDQPGNTASATVTFFARDTSNNWQPVGSSAATFGFSQSGWTEQAFNIIYTDTLSPTRCEIVFNYPSNAAATKGISFYLDEISFSTNTEIFDYDNIIGPRLFPCPSDKQLSAELNSSATVKVFDLLGNQIYSRIFASGSNIIGTGDMPNGIYIINIRYENGQVQTEKIIINHP